MDGVAVTVWMLLFEIEYEVVRRLCGIRFGWKGRIRRDEKWEDTVMPPMPMLIVAANDDAISVLLQQFLGIRRFCRYYLPSP